MKPRYKPMLAQLAETPFNSKEWIFEIKWDGIRAISYLNDKLSIRSRNEKELKYNFPELEELTTLTRNAVLDGEIVVIRDGKADFQILSERSRTTSLRNIEHMTRDFPATYVVFDILEKNNEPLIDVPLIDRKTMLKETVREGGHVILSMFVEEEGEAYYHAAIKKSIEGIMAKKKDSPYESGVRSGNWLKIKKLVSCDCVIFGYTVGEGNRKDTFGALILGLYDEGRPVYIGKVGTGFSQTKIEELVRSFQELKVGQESLPGVDVPEKISWLEPKLVCEIAYQNITRDRRLRLPRFRGLRNDKNPLECTIDQIKPSSLQEYASKRDFDVSPEPIGGQKKEEGRIFVVQEHHARRLHYDFRLEREGVLKSWAVPKGMPEKPGDKRLAVETEDHPLGYSQFEGTIPPGQYGAGTVKIWDRGQYELKVWDKDLIEFVLRGKTLNGRYALAKFKKAGEKSWLLLKAKD